MENEAVVSSEIEASSPIGIDGNPSIRDLFGFVLSQNFDSYASLSILRKLAADHYFDKLSSVNAVVLEEFISSISDFNFFDKTCYNSVVPLEDCLLTNLANFRDELLIYIDKAFNKNRPSYKLTRQVSPPLEAYVYVGHSKLNLISTGRDYGLLFE
jgi:hypothetical protein